MKISTESYAVLNLMEHVAEQVMEHVLAEDEGACRCPKCRDDLKSQMLNHLEPMYVPAADGEQPQTAMEIGDLEEQVFNKAMYECLRAAKKIKENPRHDWERSPLHNSTETMVLPALRDVLTREGLELSFEELSTIMADILNSLKPHYVTTPKGDVFTRTLELDPGAVAKVYARVYNALQNSGKL